MEWTKLCGRLHHLKHQLPTTSDDTFRTYATLGGHYSDGSEIPDHEVHDVIARFQHYMQDKHGVMSGILVETANVICGDYTEPLYHIVLEQYPRFPQKPSMLEWYICELALYLMEQFAQDRISVTLPSYTFVYEAEDVPNGTIIGPDQVQPGPPEEPGSEPCCDCQHDNPDGIPKADCVCNEDRTPEQLKAWERLRTHDGRGGAQCLK